MENIRMLCPREVSHYTGLSYEHSLEIVKAHGIRMGMRWFISREKLERVLIGKDDDG